MKLKNYVEVVLDSSDENKYMKHRTFTAQYKSLIYPNSGRWKLPVRLEKLSYGYSPFVFPETQMQQNCTVDLIPNRNGTHSTQMQIFAAFNLQNCIINLCRMLWLTNL